MRYPNELSNFESKRSLSFRFSLFNIHRFRFQIHIGPQVCLVCLVHILRSNVVELSMRSCIVFFYQLWQNVKIFSGFLTVQISVDHCLYCSIKPLCIISFLFIHCDVMIDVVVFQKTFQPSFDKDCISAISTSNCSLGPETITLTLLKFRRTDFCKL